ncbi:hypothetical protein PROFUN_13978 [Planoprotostelium fungivorum]|uniref:Protein kinase domain-containing protein n=1 Tax=Planoprotostelium fungivorum TaxID=1890364 RepID=A0A2P6N2Q5_9EUKA|nr:hypothetical protein PROFUN_13978 [Planoprotostelium fungivorum]
MSAYLRRIASFYFFSLTIPPILSTQGSEAAVDVFKVKSNRGVVVVLWNTVVLLPSDVPRINMPKPLSGFTVNQFEVIQLLLFGPWLIQFHKHQDEPESTHTEPFIDVLFVSLMNPFLGKDEELQARENPLKSNFQTPPPCGMSQSTSLSGKEEITAANTKMNSLSSTRQSRSYSVTSTISTSNYSSLSLARSEKRNSHNFVIKHITKNEDTVTMIKNEVEAGKKLKHDNIVRFVESYDDGDRTNIVLEYVNGCNLWEYMNMTKWQSMEESKAKRMFRGLAKAIKHTHRKDIAHLDIKLENIRVTPRGDLILIDFGLCQRKTQELCNQFGGTDEYAAPEVRLRIPFMAPKADVWCAGMVLYIMLMGVMPFNTNQLNEWINGDQEVKLEWTIKKGTELPSQSARELVTSMLKMDPAERPDMNQVLKHLWLKPEKRSFFRVFSRR